MKKKESSIMCGSCYNEFPESELTLVTMHINTGVEHNGRYCKNLCGKCMKKPYYLSRILETERPRKFN
jgi:protein-arginine kinase activator protein McsA